MVAHLSNHFPGPSFIHLGSLIVVDPKNGCSNEDPPVNINVECRELHQAVPMTRSSRTSIMSGDGTNVTCYPVTGRGRWCATCRDKAGEGEPGYCSEQDKDTEADVQNRDYSYDTPNDVSHDKAWGYCDKQCFTTMPDCLEEVKLQVLSTQGCIDRTYNLNSMGEKKNRKSSGDTDTSLDIQTVPMVDRELCAAVKNVMNTVVYKKKESGYAITGIVDEDSWGGSKSCQGDPGGALYSLDAGGKAVLLGLAVRAMDCAGKNSTGIFARISHYYDWIQEHARQGRCGKDTRRTRAGRFDIFT